MCSTVALGPRSAELGRTLMPIAAIGLAVSLTILPAKSQSPDEIAQEPPVTACDTLTAHELDPQRKADGISFEKINPAVAIPACETAVNEFPDNDRLIFQLGRAYQRNGNLNGAIAQYR